MDPTLGYDHNASLMRGYAHLDLEYKIGDFWSHEFVLISEFIWIYVYTVYIFLDLLDSAPSSVVFPRLNMCKNLTPLPDLPKNGAA